MYIEPAKYTELIEEVRALKKANETLSYENKVFLNQFKAQQQEKEKAIKNYEQMNRELQAQAKQILQTSKKQLLRATQQHERQIQSQKLTFSKKFIDDEKSSYAKLKKLQLQHKDLRLTSYRNEQFILKLQKLYAPQANATLQQLQQWLKKLTKKDKPNKSTTTLQSIKSLPKRTSIKA